MYLGQSVTPPIPVDFCFTACKSIWILIKAHLTSTQGTLPQPSHYTDDSPVLVSHQIKSSVVFAVFQSDCFHPSLHEGNWQRSARRHWTAPARRWQWWSTPWTRATRSRAPTVTRRSPSWTRTTTRWTRAANVRSRSTGAANATSLSTAEVRRSCISPPAFLASHAPSRQVAICLVRSGEEEIKLGCTLGQPANVRLGPVPSKEKKTQGDHRGHHSPIHLHKLGLKTDYFYWRTVLMSFCFWFLPCSCLWKGFDSIVAFEKITPCSWC